ncbi:Endoglucanase a, partial [Globisporangium splendens]
MVKTRSMIHTKCGAAGYCCVAMYGQTIANSPGNTGYRDWPRALQWKLHQSAQELAHTFKRMLSSFCLVSAALIAARCAGQDAAAAQDAPLCSLPSVSYANAKQNYPNSTFAISELEKHSIATWYSDRNDYYMETAAQLVVTCPESSRLSVVVYGLPNKDCEAGSSRTGSIVQTADAYTQFLSTLIGIINDRKVLYVLEPDAIGLLAKEGGCGVQAGHQENLQIAIAMLSANPNAEIYLDVGYWSLQHPESTTRVSQIVKGLTIFGRVKGITLNASNYRSNAEISQLCATFQQAIGSDEYRCIVDTSRNFNAPTTTEWCNTRSAGIGHPPTSKTGFSNLDYFMWIKPPGESDGKCDAESHTADALPGPAPGQFFDESFQLLWNQGYFVNELGMRVIGEDAALTPGNQTQTLVTDTPVAQGPDSVTELPTLSPTMTPTISVVLHNESQQEIPDSLIAAPVPDELLVAIPADPSIEPTMDEILSRDPDSSTSTIESGIDVVAATPCPSRPSAPSDDEILASLRLSHEQVAGFMQSNKVDFASTELLPFGNNEGRYEEGVEIVAGPLSDPDAAQDETEHIENGSSSTDAVDLVNLVKRAEASRGSSSGSSDDDGVKALSAERLPPSFGSSNALGGEESEASTSSVGKGGGNRTEVLASIGVLGVICILAVAVAAVKTKHRRDALMEARLSTPDTLWVADYAAVACELIAACPKSSRLSVVVYGLPNKDCDAGYSTGGNIKTAVDYTTFLKTLTSIFGNRKVLHVLELGAVGLLVKTGGCGEQARHRENLKTAIRLLSANSNTDICLDLVVDVIKTLVAAGRVKGIMLNTSIYRSNAGLSSLCTTFQNAIGSSAYRCIVDTSRNSDTPTSTEWCNVRDAGIEHQPTSDTVYSNLDYFLWIKIPGKSDDAYNDGTHNLESVVDPTAGQFFPVEFRLLWNRGCFTATLMLPRISNAACVESYGLCGTDTTGPRCSATASEYCQPWNPTSCQCRPVVYCILPADCCPRRADAAGCTAYVFVNCNSDGWSACYLKSGTGVRKTVLSAVSAQVLSPKAGCTTALGQYCGNSQGTQCFSSGAYCQPWNSDYYQCIQEPSKCSQRLTNVDFYGNDMAAVHGLSTADCCTRCSQTNGCEFIRSGHLYG